MKRFLILFLVFLSSTLLIGCKNSNQDKIWGEYDFDKIIYLSPLSSSTPEYIETQMKGTKYIIKEDAFEVISSDSDYKISQPVYKKEKIDDDYIKVMGGNEKISISEYKEKYRYVIYNTDNKKANYYLYLLDGNLWIASYADNTANNSEIIMNIFKLIEGSKGPLVDKNE